MKYLLTVLFSVLFIIVKAENISVKQAETYANQFFKQYPYIFSNESSLQLTWDGETQQSRHTDSKPAFYVFNRGVDQGFVIVSGSTATNPILAYSFSGNFSIKEMPDNLKAWMKAMKENIREKEELNLSRSDKEPPSPTSVTDTGKETTLETPNWNQDDPYYLKCPTLYGRHCYTGCAITATAIVMGYHKWPNKGVGVLPQYRSQTYGFRLGPISLGETYQWDRMPYLNHNSPNVSVEEEAEAISTLMYHIGVMAQADYSTSGTRAHLYNVAEGLQQYMKYKPNLKYLSRTNYSDQEWSNMLRDEIDAKRPVIYEGFDDFSGHAFVIDGYNDSGYFSVNWGWGGYNNGFYLLDEMTPGSQGIGGSNSGSYNLSQGGIFNLTPRADSEVEIDLLEFISSQTYASGLVVEDLTLPAQKGDWIVMDAGLVRNMGTNRVNGIFSLAMTDSKGNIIQDFKKVTVSDWRPASNLLVTDYKMAYEIQQEVKPGYRVRLLFKSTLSDTWKPVTCDPSIGKWEVILNDSQPDEDTNIEKSTKLEYNVQTGVITISTLSGVEASLKNKENDNDYSPAMKQQKNTITIASQKLDKGEYILTLQKGADKKDIVLKF